MLPTLPSHHACALQASLDSMVALLARLSSKVDALAVHKGEGAFAAPVPRPDDGQLDDGQLDEVVRQLARTAPARDGEKI